MFPQDIIGDVTIYPRYVNKDGQEMAIRCVLKGCFWNDESIAIFQKTGQQTDMKVVIYIPYAKELTGRQYIDVKEWIKIPTDKLKDYWTIDPDQLPLIVKGANDHEFQISTDKNRIAQQEMNLLKKDSRFKRVTDIDENLFGSEEMHYILLRC